MCPPHLQVKSRGNGDFQHWETKISEVGQEKQTLRISLESHTPEAGVGAPAEVAVRNQMLTHVFLLAMEIWNHHKHNSSFPLICTPSSGLTVFQTELRLATKTCGTAQAHLLVLQPLVERSLLAIPSLSGPRAPQPTATLENLFCWYSQKSIFSLKTPGWLRS